MTDDLTRELEIVQKVQTALTESGPFVSLAEAARQTGVPLATLADAVRSKRLPALQVQDRRWLVRVSAVSSFFGKPRDAYALQRRLVEAGLLHEVKRREQRKFARFKPVRCVDGVLVSQQLVEERR